MTRLLIVGLLCAWVLTGCATPTFMWTAPAGGSEADYRRDTYECKRDMHAHFPTQDVPLIVAWIQGPSYQRRAASYYRSCMEARGYRLTR